MRSILEFTGQLVVQFVLLLFLTELFVTLGQCHRSGSRYTPTVSRSNKSKDNFITCHLKVQVVLKCVRVGSTAKVSLLKNL